MSVQTWFRRRLFVVSILLTSAAVLSGCVQDADTYTHTNLPVASLSPPTNSPPPKTQAQTINIEAQDRIARFRRLAETMGTTPPQIEEVYAPAGTVVGVNAPVPVVRVVFPEKVFFDFNQAIPRPEAMQIIETVAANMRRDVPDASLTLLGHTDGIGSDEYNVALSQRRASTVLAELVRRDVNPNQLNTVAIGKAQPIATNSTDEGRALNRRVEFLISGSEKANLSVVEDRPINSAYLTAPGQAAPLLPPKPVVVLKPIRPPSGPADEGMLGPTGILTLRTPDQTSAPIEAVSTTITPVAAPKPVLARPSAPAPKVILREPEKVLPAPLGDVAPLNF